MIAFAARRFAMWSGAEPVRPPSPLPIWLAILLLLAAPLFFALEFAREQVMHPIVVTWIIASFPIILTLLICWMSGGRALLLAELFPVLFFLTAVPWPPRFEQPITAGLMNAVAAATAALLHLCGISAQTAGGAITLRGGIVGITEACSGIRSLQSGIMFGLAMGEWFLLRPLRRVALLIIAIALALSTNLLRTFVLSLQAEWHGVASVEKIHDLTGNIVVTVMVVAIWFCGRLLRGRTAPAFSIDQLRERCRTMAAHVPRNISWATTALLVAGLAGIITAQVVSGKLDAQDRTQTAAFFFLRDDPGVSQTRIDLPRDVWNELHPSSGEAIRVRDRHLGYAESYHFFWKPSPWNRFVLVHRPDICMPGVGWQSAGGPEPVTIDVSGRSLQLYAFRFRRGDIEALELWGVWRNGDPVPLNYDASQVLGASAAPPSLNLEGKRRSATEIVSCVIAGTPQSPPEPARAVAILRSLFDYQPGNS